VKGVGGACISVQRQRAVQLKGRKGRKRNELPTQCGPESKIKLTVVARKPGLVKDAQQHFKAAIRLWGDGSAVGKIKGKDDAEKGLRAAQMTYWVGAAKFYEAETLYEQFLGIEFPTKLDFSENKPAKKKDSLRRFQDWMKNKQTTLAKTKTRYMDVVENIKGGGAHWAVASASRVGQLYQNFSDALFTAQIPTDVRTGPYAEDAVDAYCDELTTAANPLEEESVKAYSFCLDESTKRNWFNEWSRTCEAELGQIRPQDFPSASELHAAPTAVPVILDIEGPVSMLDQPKGK
jgi:hypothetical protein